MITIKNIDKILHRPHSSLGEGWNVFGFKVTDSYYEFTINNVKYDKQTFAPIAIVEKVRLYRNPTYLDPGRVHHLMRNESNFRELYVYDSTIKDLNDFRKELLYVINYNKHAHNK